MSHPKYDYHSTWAEIDLKSVLHNFKELKKHAGTKTKILSVVKADAYGHGMLEVAKLLNKRTDLFGVADIDEGILLRQNGIRKPVLVFANALPEHAQHIVDYNLTATVCSLQLAAALNHCAKKAKKRIPVHIKIDTGMGRLGVWHREALSFTVAVFQFPNLVIEGIYTHFPSADTDRAFTEHQTELLSKLIFQLQKIGMDVPLVHASNSAGLVGFKSKVLNVARPGLMLYGMYPDQKFKSKIRLKPVMAVKSRMMFVKDIEKGRSISYGRTFKAKRPMTVATLPVGYSDGYFRILSNNACVLAGGKRCPLLGRVTMDLIVADVSRLKNAEAGDEVVLLGRQGTQEITADEIAQKARTINYEVTCSLGSRLPRVYV